MRYRRGGRMLSLAMSSSTLTSPLTRREIGRAMGRNGSAPAKAEVVEIAAQRSGLLELDTASSHWQLALDAAQRALSAAGGLLPAPELQQRQRELARERQQTARDLERLAHAIGIKTVPWLSPVPVDMKMLGLPAGTRACLFDLDGDLTDSAVLHAAAWGEVFDDFLMRSTIRTGWQFIPFDRETDYHAYIDGRTRIEGIHAFLSSRGIHLPEGRLDDPSEAETARGLAKRKGEVLARGLRQHGVTALAGARRYLEAAGHAGLQRAVVSASTTTLPMLDLALLATLVEESVDADDIRSERLQSRPAPDLLLVACHRLGVRPEEAVTFTRSPAGVAAGHAAGLAVIGVGDQAQRELLQGFGAERVVSSLRALLDPQLSDS